MGDKDPKLEFEGSAEDDFEVLIPGRDEIPPEKPPEKDEYKELDRDALIARIERERTEREEINRKADAIAALNQNFENLNKNLVRPRNESEVHSAPPAPPYQPIDPEDFNKNILEDPYKHVSKVVQEQLQKLDAPLQQIASANKYLFKQNAYQDKDSKYALEKYPDEVESIVKTFTPLDQMRDPDVYKKACRIVLANHVEEVINHRIDEVLRSREGEQSKTAISASSGFNETISRPTPKKKTLVPTPDDLRKAAISGVDVEKYMRVKYGKH